MNINLKMPAVRATALCALTLALAGCDSVKDVRSEPSTDLPPERVVLQGIIHGLGGGRAITLTYNGTNVISLVGADPAGPTEEIESVPFSFGSLDAGTEYNVVVTEGGQPFGKECVPVSGNTGTLTKGVPTLVEFQCTPNVPRRDLTVTIPPTQSVFSGLPGAKVVLSTGEWMQKRDITPGQTSVTFEDALFSATIPLFNPNGTPVLNPDGSQAQGPAGQPLTWTVSASFVDADGRESRCLVTNNTGSNPVPTTANPSGNVTNVIVGASATTTVPACQFTMSGTVTYNPPPGGATETGPLPGGLLLEVRDTQNRTRTSYEVDSYGAFTIGGTTTPTLFTSNVAAIYDVVVARHPTGRTCVVGDGGAVSYYRTGSINPASVTDTGVAGGTAGTRAWGSRLNVFCRAVPVGGRELSGTYRLSSSTWRAAPSTTNPNPLPITATFNNYDWTVQNMGSSNMLTFFADGTFLYGTHAYIAGSLPDLVTPASPYSTQVEHGFYDYDPAGTLRFTLITDTNPTAVFPATYAATDNIVWNAARTGSHGLSAAPAPTVTGTPAAGGGIGMWNAVMTGVQRSTITFNGGGRGQGQPLRRITGVFGGATATAARLDYELTEPQSIAGEMTGTWISRDHRRFWVWDYLTYYGTHVGVSGGAPSMNDACFTVADSAAAVGVYTRRGSSTGCYAYNRPARGTAYLFGFGEAADFHLTDVTLSTNTFVGVASLASATGGSVASSRLAPQFGTTALAVLPGFVGRMPGGQTAADGRSPSPVVYLIAPAASFEATVGTTFYDDIGQPASAYFDDFADQPPFTDWCSTEVVGVRPTLNGRALNYPVYFCRTRAP